MFRRGREAVREGDGEFANCINYEAEFGHRLRAINSSNQQEAETRLFLPNPELQ